MISPTAVALVVALPLLLCLLMLLCILLLRGRRLHASLASDGQQLRDKCDKLEKRLSAFPKGWEGKFQKCGFSREEVREPFGRLLGGINEYVYRWIDSDNPRNESVARIEAVLFPEPPPEHALAVNKDTRVFPNPHQYTPAEICTFLEQAKIRRAISEYIMGSILLHVTSLEGDPFKTLLPLVPADIYGLHRLKNMIRGIDLTWNVHAHISKFGFYYAFKADTKAPFIALFESLFDPYFKSISLAEVAQRRQELKDILDTAITLGMRIVGQATDKMEYHWGARRDISIVTMPSLHALVYEDKELKYDTEITKLSAARVKWDKEDGTL